MTVETELEKKIGSVISSMDIDGYKVVLSRQIGDLEEDEDNDGVISITTGFREHDNFSLPMFNIPIAITIVSRIEVNPNGATHEEVVEKIINKICFWHRNPLSVEELNGDTYIVGEIRLSGGGSRELSKDNAIWTDTITANIRGSEKYI